jgi:hypothetical protein
MKRCVMTMCLVSLVVSVALAQKKTAPPPPKPADKGPSLVDTMKFIQDKLTDQNKIIYVDDGTDTEEGTNFGTVRFTDTYQGCCESKRLSNQLRLEIVTRTGAGLWMSFATGRPESSPPRPLAERAPGLLVSNFRGGGVALLLSPYTTPTNRMPYAFPVTR